MDDKTALFTDAKDWGDAIACGIFLVVFPPVIVAMWLQPRDVIPLFFVIPFTVLFAFAAPFLWTTLRKARSREIVVDLQARHLRVTERAPFARDARIIGFERVAALVFRTIDNDGFWHKAVIRLDDGEELVFHQGALRDVVRPVFDRMTDMLRQAIPDLPTEDIKSRD